MMNYLPKWAEAYARGDSVGKAQAMMAYADYYCVDGSADDEPEIEERIAMDRPPLVSYASMTGTRRNLAAMRAAGWKLLVSATGQHRVEAGFEYAIDNGAWTAFQQCTPFDEYAFMTVVEKLGERADWIVLPDIVAGGLASLEFSLSWLERLRALPTRLLIAVQDGMEIEDVRTFLSPAVGIFVGGTTEWKEATMGEWGSVARRRHCYLHVGRVNTARRIRICAAAGANSIDGTSGTRYAKSVPKLDRVSRQPDMFSRSSESLAEAQAAGTDVSLSGLIR